MFHFPIPDDEESEEEVAPAKPTVPVPKRRFEGEDEEEDVAVRVSALSPVLSIMFLKPFFVSLIVRRMIGMNPLKKKNQHL